MAARTMVLPWVKTLYLLSCEGGTRVVGKEELGTAARTVVLVWVKIFYLLSCQGEISVIGKERGNERKCTRKE